MTFGNKLKEMRHAEGLTQEELAEKLFVRVKRAEINLVFAGCSSETALPARENPLCGLFLRDGFAGS